MVKPELRNLTNDNFEAYKVLRTMGFETDPGSFWSTIQEAAPGMKEKYGQRIQSRHNFTLGAFDDGRLIGMMAFVRQSLSKLSFKGDIYGVYIHPQFREQGIASQLLRKTLEQAFSQEGLTKIGLTVTATNHGAKRLYDKHGFETFGIEENGMIVDGQMLSQYWMHLMKENWVQRKQAH